MHHHHDTSNFSRTSCQHTTMVIKFTPFVALRSDHLHNLYYISTSLDHFLSWRHISCLGTPCCWHIISYFGSTPPAYYMCIPVCYTHIPACYTRVPVCHTHIPVCHTRVPVCYTRIPVCYTCRPACYTHIRTSMLYAHAYIVKSPYRCHR